MNWWDMYLNQLAHDIHKAWIPICIYLAIRGAVGFYEGWTGKKVWDHLGQGELPPRKRIDPHDGSRWVEVRGQPLRERILSGRREPTCVIQRRLP
jgi:hypothetical protein